MISSKFYSNTKFINFTTKTCNYFKYDSSVKRSYSLLAHIHTLKKNNLKTTVYCALNNINYDSVFNISTSSYLHDAPKPIEYPPPKPPPADAETEEFGLLGGMKYGKVALDAEELKEEDRLKKVKLKIPRKLKPSAGQYAQMIKTHVEKGDLEKAEYVIEECKRNRDKPTEYMYTLLIKAFAMHGNIGKCIHYYGQMKTKRHKIKGNVYTSLLDGCANSPDSEKALKYLERVKVDMTKASYPINHFHYNVLIKAYGRHHKLEEANKILQLMLEKKMKIGISTICSLMYAANSNSESGLKYVLRIWQLMRKLKVPPNIFSYNLMLRAIRDCHFGDCTVNDLLLTDRNCPPAIVTDDNRPDLLIYPPILSNLPLDNIHKQPKLTALLEAPKSEHTDHTSDDTNDNLPAEVNNEILPESIANLDLDAILRQNKLILFGGVEGFLEKMKNDKVEPNVKSLTYLIELVPSSVAAENIILKQAKSNKIALDVDFFNMLIKKRALRGAKKDAKDILDEIHKADLKPNIVTYGVLALCCTTLNEARNLIKAMKCTGHTINKYVADTLLNTAIDKRDFYFVLELMELMKYERVRLDEQTFEKLDKFQKDQSALVKSKHKAAQSEKFKVGFGKFNMRYKSWQEDMGRKILVEHSDKKA